MLFKNKCFKKNYYLNVCKRDCRYIFDKIEEKFFEISIWFFFVGNKNLRYFYIVYIYKNLKLNIVILNKCLLYSIRFFY